MLPRALGPLVFCAAVSWPLRVLACMNSMESSVVYSGPILTREALWVDLFLWTVGAVFLNRIVLVNLWGPAAQGQPLPSGFRRSFFLLVGACVVLLLLAVSAAGPLLGLNSHRLSECMKSPTVLLVLLTSPVVVFVLQAVLFQRVSQWLFDGDRKVALVTLVLTSMILSVGVDLGRQAIAPVGCKPEPVVSYEY